MAASDLAALADVKTWLSGSSGIGSSDDSLLARLITDVSGAITAYLGRPSLTPRAFIERLDGNGKARMFLRHYPALPITSLLIDNAVSRRPRRRRPGRRRAVICSSHGTACRRGGRRRSICFAPLSPWPAEYRG